MKIFIKTIQKKNEILQNETLLEPKLAILDETDSGLDIDALHLLLMEFNNVQMYFIITTIKDYLII